MITFNEFRSLRAFGVPWTGILRIILFRLGIVWVARKH